MKFNPKGRRTRREREGGLLFSWRGGESNLAAMLVAVLLVALVASAVGGFVRVRIGDDRGLDEARATLVVVPADEAGVRLLRAAVEAGPYPLRWNPAADPEYAALRGRAMRQAATSGLRYQPRLRSLDGELVSNGEAPEPESFLPPLPGSPLSTAASLPGEARVRARLIGAGNGIRLAALPLSAADAVAVDGRRFLVGIDPAGRVGSVTPLDPGELPVDLEAWLRRARLDGGAEAWRVIETQLVP